MDRFEIKIMAQYLLRLLDENCCNGKLIVIVGHFITKFQNKFSINLNDSTRKFLEDNDNDENCIRKSVTDKLYNGISKSLRDFIKNEEVKISQLQKNIDNLVETLKLSETDSQILSLIARYYLTGKLNSFIDQLTREDFDLYYIISSMIGISEDSLTEVFRKGRAVELGVINICSSGRNRDLDDNFSLNDKIKCALSKSYGDKEDLCRLLLGTSPAKQSLDWNDFEHLDPVPEKLHKFLRGALDQRLKGINILLYGRAGTGKTEFSKTLASQLGVPLYSIGEVDDDGNEPIRNERVGSLRLAQAILNGGEPCLLLIDEMDDVLTMEGGLFQKRKGSKVYFNRMLENNVVPVLWTINDIDLLDEATIRRMTIVVEMKSAPEAKRLESFNKVLMKQKLELSESEIDSLSSLKLSPAIIANAAKFSQVTEGGIEDFRFVAESATRAINGGKLPVATIKSSADVFIPSLTNADIDLDELILNLQNSQTRAFSLILFGPSGTGKSAFVRHLSECLRMPVLFKRTSDLISKYVGESEQQIAACFAEALDKGAFLIFDEADSLLGDRRLAQRNWEVSQVNEMLTWMESHTLPFACTTNLKERLDPASLRRFTFKSCFDYLRSDQLTFAFEHFFQQSLSKAQVSAIGKVTSGDFAVVSKKLKIFGRDMTTQRLIELLNEESICRDEGINKTQIGFSIAV